MMRWLSLLLILACVRLHAATGDIAITIDPGGYSAVVRVEGVNTNPLGTSYNFFLKTNSFANGTNVIVWLEPTANTPRISLTDMGFDENGSATTRQRTVYLVSKWRQPYPSNALPDEWTSGGDAYVRVALGGVQTGRVYQRSSNLVATIPAGMYVSGGVSNNAASGLTVTNGCTVGYPRVIPNWSYVNQKRWITNASTTRFWLKAYHNAAQAGKQVAAVQFIHTPTTGTPITNTVRQMSIDYGLNSTVAAVWALVNPAEFIESADWSSFSGGQNVRTDFRVVGWIGDENSAFDTRNNTYTGTTPLPAGVTNYWDPSMTYGQTIAVVDPINGSDTNGRVTNGVPATEINSAHYFATGRAAGVQGASTNNLKYSHNDIGNMVVYLKSTCTNFSGGTVGSLGNAPAVWPTFTAYPGHTVVLTNAAGTENDFDLIKFKGITIGYIGNEVGLNDQDRVWFDQCTFDSTGAGPIQNCDWVAITHSRILRFEAGLKPFAAPQNNAFALFRGNDFTGFNKDVVFQNVFVGNVRATNSGAAFRINNDLASSVVPTDFQVFAENYFVVSNVTGSTLFGANQAITNGLAIVNNTWEGVSDSAVTLCGGSPNTTNVLIMHNTIAGVRNQFLYNETSSPFRTHSIAMNNIFEVCGFASDDTQFEGARTNNWDVKYQVGFTGNVYQQSEQPAVTHGNPSFIGLWNFNPTVSSPSSTNWAGYVSRRSFVGSAPSPGGGDYRLSSRSPVGFLRSAQITSHDQKGYSTTSQSIAGANAIADPRRAGTMSQ